MNLTFFLGSRVDFLSCLTDDRWLKTPPDTDSIALYPACRGGLAVGDKS